jgi:hypothetical protein
MRRLNVTLITRAATRSTEISTPNRASIRGRDEHERDRLPREVAAANQPLIVVLDAFDRREPKGH